MSRFLDLSPEERNAYFRVAADRLKLSTLVVEKDFWVCWTLNRIFSLPNAATRFVFKGGTSLSKVFGIIDRFSEDIDLGVTPAELGWKESDLDEAPSPNQRRKRMKELEAACADWLDKTLRPALEQEIRSNMPFASVRENWLRFEMDAQTNSPVLNFMYPSAFAHEAGYIAPLVKLEFGSLTDQQPRGPHAVKPLLADAIAEPFSEFRANVIALEVERTFWEKATILHSQYHRPEHLPIRDRYARHYSDFAALWRHPSRDLALARVDLLARVALHKSRFFGSSWTSYETAKPGQLKLVPKAGKMAALLADYAKMEPMFATKPPPFSKVIEDIADAEQRINAL
jgi:hypothetical protein